MHLCKKNKNKNKTQWQLKWPKSKPIHTWDITTWICGRSDDIALRFNKQEVPQRCRASFSTPRTQAPTAGWRWRAPWPPPRPSRSRPRRCWPAPHQRCVCTWSEWRPTPSGSSAGFPSGETKQRGLTKCRVREFEVSQRVLRERWSTWAAVVVGAMNTTRGAKSAVRKAFKVCSKKHKTGMTDWI